MQRPDVLLQLRYIWRHVSAVKRPSSGQQRIVLLRYRQIVCPVESDCLHFILLLNILIITKNFIIFQVLM